MTIDYFCAINEYDEAIRTVNAMVEALENSKSISTESTNIIAGIIYTKMKTINRSFQTLEAIAKANEEEQKNNE